MTFAKRVFNIAGIYGLVSLVPMYFLESKIARDAPPPITHPEFFYGFLGVALAWQLMFLVIARDPARYRLAMIPAIVEKIGYGATTLVLYAVGRLAASGLVFGTVDLLLGVLFAAAFLRTAASSETRYLQ